MNSGAGILVGNGARVVGCDLHHNGQTGIAGEGNDIRIENNRIWANNIYGFDYKWEAGGVKLATSDGVVLRGNRVFDNVGPGLWCDIGCRNVLYENNIVERNHDAGIFHEISFNAVIRNNSASNNGLDADPDWFWGADILISASQDVEVTGNTLTVRPGGCGIMLIDQGRVTGQRRAIQDPRQHNSPERFDLRGRALRGRHFRHRARQCELLDHHRRQQSLRRQCLPCPDEQGGAVSLGAPSLELGWAARGWVGAERPADVLLTRWAR